MAGETEPFFVKGRSSTLISSSFPSERSIEMIESRECTAPPGSIGEDQEATSMGDLLSDIFSSHFSQASLAANSPQDLFGILDLLETPHETSKFMSLIEESGNTCNNNNSNNREAEASHLKLPVLEQEPEIEPTTDNNICTTLVVSNVDHHGSSKTTHMHSSSHSNSGAASDLFKDALHTCVRDSNKCQFKSSETCDALLEKSWSFQSNLPEDFSESETDYMLEQGKHKRLKVLPASSSSTDQVDGDGQRMTHIAVERNRRKQMNEHLAVLRSLMPGFYVQRGDQASIIGGVIEFINELQQLLQSLESKKQRKAYAEVLSPRPMQMPMQCGTSGATPNSTPTPSPRAALPISPRTPQSAPTPCTTTHSRAHRAKNKSMPMSIQLHPTSASSFMDPSFETVKELVANSKSAVADVEVKIAGSNALLKTLSHRIPGQMLKLVQTLEGLSLEILHLNISTIDDTVLNSFTLKIGIECKLSVEELAQAVQQTFSC